MRMVFLWGKSFAPRSLYYGNGRLLAVNVLIVSRVVNHVLSIKSIPCVLFTFEYTLCTLRTKEKGQSSYELERGINWNTFKSITATVVHTSRHGLIPRPRSTTDKIKTKNLNTTCITLV